MLHHEVEVVWLRLRSRTAFPQTTDKWCSLLVLQKDHTGRLFLTGNKENYFVVCFSHVCMHEYLPLYCKASVEYLHGIQNY